jgi:methyl-accepting chemotaxis protein
VKRVTDIIGEIASASQEQLDGIEQINVAISEMDETTQRNAALVEQASAAAGAMSEQAAQLSGTVGVFTLAAPTTGRAAIVSRLPKRTSKRLAAPEAPAESVKARRA